MRIKIAIPTSENMLCSHFGHCELFDIYTISNGKVTDIIKHKPPKHEPGSHVMFLKDMGANLVIAGGMGMKAQNLFNNYGIQMIIGAPNIKSEEIVEKYLNGTLSTGNNQCDH